MTKILILHDTFLYRGGGERLIIMMAKALNADIASGFFSHGSYNLVEQGFQGKTYTLMPRWFLHEFRWMPQKMAFICKNGLRHFGLKWAFLVGIQQIPLNKYDTVIFSGDCISATKHCSEKHMLYYCHTIPRYLFDQEAMYDKKVPRIIRPIYFVIKAWFKKSYFRDLDRIPTLLTNSKNTQNRIKKFTGKNALIVYPPVDTDFFVPITINEKRKTNNSSRYFLSFSRLSAIKRVDRIILAFQQMPDTHLIVTYGINDPEKDAIMNLAHGYPNIQFCHSPSDKELLELIQHAQATIYVPEDEDFGMIPLESMACGIPVIGVNEGGLKETIMHGKTGILIDRLCRPSDIMEAIYTFPVLKIEPRICRARASDFSLVNFQSQIRNLVL